MLQLGPGGAAFQLMQSLAVIKFNVYSERFRKVKPTRSDNVGGGVSKRVAP